MAMKMINKSECEYKGGYIVYNDKVMCINNKVVDLFNKLDVDVQHAQFEATNKPKCFEPVDEFVAKSEHGAIYPKISANTPELDAAAEKALKIMDEIDAIADAEKVNEYFLSIDELFEFVSQDFIVSGDQPTQHRFDLPTIGNPLKLSKEDLSDFVVSMFV